MPTTSLRLALVAAVFALFGAACQCNPSKQCTSSADCSGGGVCVDGYCVTDDGTGGGAGGGAGGGKGGGTGGSAGGGTGGSAGGGTGGSAGGGTGGSAGGGTGGSAGGGTGGSAGGGTGGSAGGGTGGSAGGGTGGSAGGGTGGSAGGGTGGSAGGGTGGGAGGGTGGGAGGGTGGGTGGSAGGGTGGSAGGGTGGGAGGGTAGGVGGGAGPLDPTLVFIAPVNNFHTADASVTLVVGLTLPDASVTLPAQLSYRGVFSDGGSFQSGVLTSPDAGQYSAAVTLTDLDVYSFFASLPDGGGQIGPRLVNFDRTGPLLTLNVQAPPNRPNFTTLISDDPAGVAWQRDEEALVSLSSSSSDLDDGGFTLRIAGLLADGGQTPLADAGIRVRNAGACTACSSATCRCFGVDLSVPTLAAFRGNFALEARGRDNLGNPSQTQGSVAVTRWRWQRISLADAGTLSAAPAIGPDGTVYVGTTSGLHALALNGGETWLANVGAVTSSPAVARSDAGVDLVFYTSTSAGSGFLGARIGSSGVAADQCSALTSSGLGGVSLLDSVVGAVPRLSAVAVLNGATAGTFFLLRPFDTTACTLSNFTSPIAQGNGPVCDGAEVFYPGTDSVLHSYSLSTGAWVGNPSYPLNFTGALGPLSIDSHGVNRVLVPTTGPAATGAYFEADGGESFTTAQPAAPTGMAVAANGLIFLGLADGSLVRLTGAGALDATASVSASGIAGTPLLTSDSRLYATTTGGQLVVADRSLAVEWTVGGLGAIAGPPSFDCDRNNPGRGGVLYLTNANGAVLAVIVDSHQLELTAPWPMDGHDPRHTANLLTPMSEFTCP